MGKTIVSVAKGLKTYTWTYRIVPVVYDIYSELAASYIIYNIIARPLQVDRDMYRCSYIY